jgi:23S rRNA-/tRNA-specific pseudouridylate synthase
MFRLHAASTLARVRVHVRAPPWAGARCCAAAAKGAADPAVVELLAHDPPVVHTTVPPGAGASLAAVVAAAANLPDAQARALINLGAVYAGSRDAPARCTRADAHQPGGAYVRVHVRPRRYPAARAVDWRSRVLHRGDGFVVVNKPASMPVCDGVDNVRESLTACVSSALRCAPLRVVHRLDICTTGVVALAETKDAAARFGALQVLDGEAASPRRLTKLYLALTAAPVALGVQSNHVTVGHKIPGKPRHTLVFDSPAADRVHCSQEVLECVPFGDLWQVCVALSTGRTHQIRALLAHRGAPIVGDTLYGGEACREPDAISLHAWKLEWCDGEDHAPVHVCAPPPWQSGA